MEGGEGLQDLAISLSHHPLSMLFCCQQFLLLKDPQLTVLSRLVDRLLPWKLQLEWGTGRAKEDAA